MPNEVSLYVFVRLFQKGQIHRVDLSEHSATAADTVEKRVEFGEVRKMRCHGEAVDRVLLAHSLYGDGCRFSIAQGQFDRSEHVADVLEFDPPDRREKLLYVHVLATGGPVSEMIIARYGAQVDLRPGSYDV